MGFTTMECFHICRKLLARHSISSYSFNFSHGGIKGDADYFEDLINYEKNCMRLEVEDVMCVCITFIQANLKNTPAFFIGTQPWWCSVNFFSKKAQDENIVINGIVLVSTVKQLNFWPEEMVDEWKQNKVYYKKNNRTKQMLPQGEEFMNEVLQSDSKWNVENEIKKLKQPILILHGENDEAVPEEHGRSLFEWVHPVNKKIFS